MLPLLNCRSEILLWWESGDVFRFSTRRTFDESGTGRTPNSEYTKQRRQLCDENSFPWRRNCKTQWSNGLKTVSSEAQAYFTVG